ncbi:MAG: hypothetical protein ABH843_07600 [Candidatus Omnitrophota bacterium]
MESKEEKKEECGVCGKKLPVQYMFRKVEKEDGTYYLCCQICFEQFSGEMLSGDPDIEYK